MITVERDGLLSPDSFPELRLTADKAALLFADNGWTWAGDPPAVPDADRITRQFLMLISDAVTDAKSSTRALTMAGGQHWAKISTGRLYAAAYEREEGTWAIELGVTFTL